MRVSEWRRKLELKLLLIAVIVLLVLVIGAITLINFAEGLGDSHNQMG